MGKEYRILEIQDQEKKSTWAREVLESLPDCLETGKRWKNMWKA